MKWLVFFGSIFAGIIFTFVIGVAAGNVPSIIVGVICLIVGVIALILIIKSYKEDKAYQDYQKFLKATASQQNNPVSNRALRIPQKIFFIETVKDCFNNIHKALEVDDKIFEKFITYTESLLKPFYDLTESEFGQAYNAMYQKDQKGLFVHVFDENGNFNYLAYAACTFHGFLGENGYDENLCAEAYEYVIYTGATDLAMQQRQRNTRYKIVPTKTSV